MKRLFIPVAAAAFALAAASHAPAMAQPTATPPPAPPVPSAEATYVPTPAATPLLPPGALPTPASNNASVTLGRKPNVKATPAPPKDTEDNRVGISGVWEVAMQRPTGVVYTHFKLTQKGDVLTGTYLDEKGKKFPLTGTVDGKSVKVIVTMPDSAPLLFSAEQDGGTDMIGTVDGTADNTIGFTAEYRPKYKWIDNLTPGTGGITNPGVP